MSPKEEGYVRSINCTCYEELRQSLKAKYFVAVQSFSLLRKTLQEVGNSLRMQGKPGQNIFYDQDFIQERPNFFRGAKYMNVMSL